MAEKSRPRRTAPASGNGARAGARPSAQTGSGQTAAADDIDRVTVTNEALATLIGLAAHEVPGIIGMAPANIREGLKRILGAQQADEGVTVARTSERAASVELHVAVAYGVNIPAVAESVKERVCYAAHAFAGVEVGEVHVHVAGVGRAGR